MILPSCTSNSYDFCETSEISCKYAFPFSFFALLLLFNENEFQKSLTNSLYVSESSNNGKNSNAAIINNSCKVSPVADSISIVTWQIWTIFKRIQKSLCKYIIFFDFFINLFLCKKIARFKNISQIHIFFMYLNLEEMEMILML